MKLSNKVYDIIKWCATILLPAGLTLLTALNAAWGWGLPMEAISATVAAVIAFLGAVMSFSSQLYLKDGGSDK